VQWSSATHHQTLHFHIDTSYKATFKNYAAWKMPYSNDEAEMTRHRISRSNSKLLLHVAWRLDFSATGETNDRGDVQATPTGTIVVPADDSIQHSNALRGACLFLAHRRASTQTEGLNPQFSMAIQPRHFFPSFGPIGLDGLSRRRKKVRWRKP